jgi:hypothetical protein
MRAMGYEYASAGPIPMASPESFQVLMSRSWPALIISWKLSTYRMSATLSKWPFQVIRSLGGTREMAWPATTYRGHIGKTTYTKTIIQAHPWAPRTVGSEAQWKGPGMWAIIVVLDTFYINLLLTTGKSLIFAVCGHGSRGRALA